VTRYWKPVTEDEIYVVRALLMLMGIVEKPTLRSCFSKNSLLATPVFGCVKSLGFTTQSSTIKVKTKLFLKISVHN
jgi:hypothetical protein